MATEVQRRRGTTTEHSTFTGADGELTVDTTKKTVVVHDGVTVGGVPLAREDLSNVDLTVTLNPGTARQLLQTNATATAVEWTDNIDVPGTLDVTSTATFDGDVTIAGDLTVNGTTTTIDAQNLLVKDKNIELGVVTTPDDTTADGGGITLKGTTDKTINWIDATDSWTSSENIDLATNKTYKIANTEVLSATTLGSGVTNSSLTAVGTITTGTWQGSAISASYLDSTVVTTGDTGTVTSTMIANGTIVDADVSASAAIVHSKLANITAGYVLIGNASNVPTATQVTGDVTISDTGVTAISSGVIVDADVSATAEIAVSKLANGTANQVLVTDGTNVSWSDDLTLAGNLTVNGTTTTINTQDLLVEDKNIIIGNVDTPTDVTADGGGITLKGATDKTINWLDATDSWTSSENIDLANGKSYRINNTEVLSATTLGSGVTSSSLTSVGTLGSVTVTGDATAGTFIPTGGTAPSNGLYLPATNSVALSTNGTGQVFITSNGNAGIGTLNASNVAGKLHLRADGEEFKSLLVLQNRNTGGSAGGAINFVNGGVDLSDNRYSYIRGIITGAGQNGNHLVFGTNANGQVASERLRITSTGLVGIGPNGAGGYDVAFNPGTSSSPLIRDSSGRLLVGTSSAPVVTSATAPLNIALGDEHAATFIRYSANEYGPFFALGKSRSGTKGAQAAVINGDALGIISFVGSNGSDFSNVAGSIECYVDGTPFSSGDTTDLPGRLVFSTTADGSSSPTERMRISSDGTAYFSGKAQFGASSGYTDTAQVSIFTSASVVGCTFDCGATSLERTHISFENSNGIVGTIKTSGSATSYNTSSDYRLKENVTPVTDGITRLQQLKPSRFNFIADPAKTVDGFLAHEVQTVVPEAITGEKDAVDDEGNPQYQGIDQSKLVPLLTAALQEAVAKIESLEARLTAAGI